MFGGNFVRRETAEQQRQHFALVDAVNNAATDGEHAYAEARLRGFREGLRAVGVDPDLCECDNHAQPELRDMTVDMNTLRETCAGVFLDWKPTR